MRAPFRVAALLVLLVPVLGWAVRHRPVPDPRLLPDGAVDHSVTYSNILPEDYVGPQACRQCHAKNYRLWSQHPHRRMNQLPGPQTIRGDFNEATLELGRGSVQFSHEGDTYYVTVRQDGRTLRRWRATRTVGSRFMQYCIGVQTEGPEPPDSPVWREHMIPLGYWITAGRWLPKHYFDPDGPELLRDGIPVVEGLDKYDDVRPWTAVCLSCHNTAPYAYRAVHRLYAGFPDATVSLAVGPLSAALSRTVETAPSLKSFEEINARLHADEHLVTLGISCESCHFGGREHAQNGGKIAFLPTSPYLKITNHRPDRPLTDSRKEPATVNGICSQCHSGFARLFPNGGATCNSREGLDFHSGSCTSQMTCVHCHEPHTAGPAAGGPTDPAHVAVCSKCHTQYTQPQQAAAHARHAGSAGVTCLDCHMPRQTLGLDALVRTHRVSLPVEEAMVASGAPTACNLCHLDKSLNWTLQELRQGWGREVRSPSRSGSQNDRPVGEAWLASNDSHLRLLASQSYARSPLGKARLPELIRSLNDPEPINRVFHARAVESVWGRKLSRAEYELTAPPAVRAAQIERLLAEFARTNR
jgi:hypothetical protein